MPHVHRKLGPETEPIKVTLADKPLSILQMLRTGRRNVVATIPKAAVTDGVIAGHMGYPYYMITDPKAIAHVLSDNVENYVKPPFTRKLLSPALGNALLLAEGKHWHWQRRAAAPIFNPRNVAALGPLMSAVAENTAARIAETQEDAAVNLYQYMVGATCDIITQVTLSAPEHFDPQEIHASIERYIATAGKLTFADLLGLPSWLSGLSAMAGYRALKKLRKNTALAITSRRAQGPQDVPDLLDHLIAAQDPKTGERMDDQLVMENALTFIVAGHETTALALTWALYLCAFDPEVQDKARREVRAHLGPRTARVDDIMHLPYIRMILDETLRLYPPASIISREAVGPDTLVGHPVEKGRNIVIPIYALHRHERLWDAPNAFKPERFAKPKEIPRYQYIPFGDGPRICIGMNFSFQEAVIILATLLARFEFDLIDGATPRPEMILTLRPHNGLWLKVRPAR